VSRKCMADKRCEGCWYWRPLGAVEGLKVCHYCIDHHELRKRDGERCLSFKAKKEAPEREQPAPWRSGPTVPKVSGRGQV